MDAPTLKTVKLDRVGNVGAGEDILLQLWVPPNILRNDGDSLFIHAATILAANGNSKTSKIYFNGVVVAGRSFTDSNALRDMTVRVYRRSPTSVWSVGLTANGATATQLVEQDDITVNLSVPIEIKLTGEAAADNDIISRVLRYIYVPVSSNFDFI